MKKILNSTLALITILTLANAAASAGEIEIKGTVVIKEVTTVPDIVAAPPFNDEGPGRPGQPGGKK